MSVPVVLDPGDVMDVAAAAAQEQQALAARLAQAREKLDGLAIDLHVVDGELEALAPERRQHQLLLDACGALEALGESGGAELFWGDAAAARSTSAEHIERARGRLDAFQQRLGQIEGRRRTILNEIELQQAHAGLVEDDLFEAVEAEERRRHEWIIERETIDLPSHALVMTWTRGGEDDQRFRKAFAASLSIGLLLALILPHIDLPLPTLEDSAVKVPERVVRMMMESRPIPPPLPHETPPPPKQLAERKPEEVVPRHPVAPEVAVKEPEQVAEVVAPPKGILAFREKFAALNDARVEADLGLKAHISRAEDNSEGRPERSMLTTNAPGSSGGINLASFSRGLAGERGTGAGGGMAGVALTRATSTIAGSGASDRPLGNGSANAGRTDEEIQIVFDRYKAALYRLYNRELRNDPTLRGQMVLRLTIEPDGSVSSCKLETTDMHAPLLADEVVDRVRTFDFGAKEVPAVTIVYPIDFLPTA
jgi:hypothetical protein